MARKLKDMQQQPVEPVQPSEKCNSSYIAGVKHRSKDEQAVLDELEESGELTLKPDPFNEFDKFAVKVMRGAAHVGFVPADLSREVSELIISGRFLRAAKGTQRRTMRIYWKDQRT